MILTEARLRVLEVLQDFRYLPAPYLGEILRYNGKIVLMHNGRLDPVKGKPMWRCSYFSDEMTRFSREHLIDSIKYPGRPYVYYLTEKGERELKDRGLYRNIEKTGEPWEDELGVCVAHASFLIGMRKYGVDDAEIGTPPFRFEVKIDYTKPNGDVIKNLPRTLIHDRRPFSMTYGGKTLNVVGMERDMDTQGWAISKYTKTSLQHHFLGVCAASRSGEYKRKLGVDNAFVPFYFTSKNRMEEGMDRFAKYTQERGAQNVLFAYLPRYQSDELYPLPTGWAFTQEYPRVCAEKNHEPFSFARELGVI